MYLIDSNVVSELMRPRPEPRVVTWLDRHGGDCALLTIAIFEVRAGISRLPTGRRRDELMRTFERVVTRFGPRVYAFDRAAAEMAAEIQGQDFRTERVMSSGDAQVAGIAAVYGLSVVTRNGGDFKATGLDLINPWES